MRGYSFSAVEVLCYLCATVGLAGFIFCAAALIVKLKRRLTRLDWRGGSRAARL